MHSCPECGQACYCGGDIDDCDVGDVEAEINCEHCDGEPEPYELTDDDGFPALSESSISPQRDAGHKEG